MTSTPHGGRPPRRPALGAVTATLLLTLTWAAAFAKLDTWRDESASAFGKGKKERVVVSEAGVVRLGHELKAVASLDAARVWDLARGNDGLVYAATGDAGKVFRREPKDGAAWTVAYDSPDTQALSLAILPDGHAFAGTGPGGKVVDLTDPAHPSSRPDPGVQYVWDLAADRQGNLYAATGPNGQLWKRSPAGQWSLLFDSKASHLLCVAVGPGGVVYAGSDGDGLIYKVAPGGKASVVYDAPQAEVRTLTLADDGTLYAGTAAESGGGSGRGPSMFPSGGFSSPGGLVPRGTETAAAALPAQDSPKSDDARKDDSRPRGGAGGGRAPGGSAAPKPPSAGENAVYRIDADGVAREVFRARVLIFGLAVVGERLLVGTGPEGQLYEVREDGHESAPIARLDSGHILAVLAEPNGGVLLGTADPGSVVRLEPGHVREGTLTSEVRDTKLISRFGAVTWKADTPAGTAVAVQIRSGNVSEPDATWSDWSPATDAERPGRPDVPAGRFVQYRAKLSTKNPAATPELKSVSLRYQSANLAPEIAKLDVPDVSAADGATRQGRLTLRWDVSDPNDDDLAFDVHLRKEDWPDWVKLNTDPVTEKTYNLDTTSVPAGTYRVRLTATDRPSNNAADALTRERVSEPFLVDQEPPQVEIKPGAGSATVRLRDRWTRIAKAAYAVDGGEWVPVFPDDRLFDANEETLTVPLAALKPGTHVLMVRATDAAGNVGTGDALLNVR